MKVLQIFIASSISEDTMKQDRAVLSAYAERLNDRLVKEDRYLRLILCEEEDQFVAQGGKQNEIDQKLIASNAALFLVGEKLGSFTRGELEAIAGALFLLQREMCRKAGLSAPPHDPLPPRIDRVSALLYRAQRTLEQSKPTPPPHKPTE